MPKRKAAPTQQEIKELEKLYDACEKEMANIKKAVAELQEAWNDTYDKLQVLYKLRDESKGVKRVRMSIKGTICPVVTRKVSYPNPPESM